MRSDVVSTVDGMCMMTKAERMCQDWGEAQWQRFPQNHGIW